MKFLVIATSLILFIINPIKAIDLKIVYIDTDKILNESNAGKDIKKQLDTLDTSKLKESILQKQKPALQTQESLLGKTGV